MILAMAMTLYVLLHESMTNALEVFKPSISIGDRRTLCNLKSADDINHNRGIKLELTELMSCLDNDATLY